MKINVNKTKFCKMDPPSELASQLRVWLHESGTLKEMQVALRAKMVHRIMSESSKIAPKKKRSTPRHLALNSLIVEHLNRTGLCFTASVMAKEAEFVVDPASSEAKFNEDQLETILSGMEWSKKRFLNPDRLRIGYYGSGRAEVSLLNVICDLLGTGEVGGDSGEREIWNRLDDLERRLRRSRSESSSRSEEEPTVTRGPSQSEDDEVSRLRSELEKARLEVDKLREENVELDELRRIVRQQNEELERLRPRGESEQNQEKGEEDLGNFVRKVRSKVDLLYQNSTSIDREFCEL